MKPARNLKRAMLIGTGGIVFVAFFLGGCRTPTVDEKKVPEKIQVIAREIANILGNHIILVSGVLEADKTVPLSFLVPGKVDQVYFDEGDHVKKDQLLARVEIDDYRSNLEISEARLLKAQDAHDRLRPLYKGGAIAEKDFIEIKAGFAQAKAARDIARKRVKDTNLRSPVSGIIGVKNVEAGQMISSGMPVFTIVKTDRIFARVSVPESEIGKITLGQKAVVTIQALEDKTMEGKVTLIGAMAEPRTRTYAVKIELSNPDYVLRTGMIAEARIVTDGIIEMITVPGKAIVRDADNLTYVFLADTAKGKAFRRRVFPGTVHRSEIQIKKGLTAGDMVITGGQHKITDGAPIIVVDSDLAER